MTTSNAATPPSTSPPTHPTQRYTPRHTSFPYTSSDFLRADEEPDTDFYSTPRLVTHIDDHAISLLKEYYRTALPPNGRILDFCSSWISHFPETLEKKAMRTAWRIQAQEKAQAKAEAKAKADADARDVQQTASVAVEPPQAAPLTTTTTTTAAAAAANAAEEDEDTLEVIGLGINARELSANPILSRRILHDLNADPRIPPSIVATPNSTPLSSSTCVVSIDYLTSPLSVLSSLLSLTRTGGTVHLAVSNRCFPTKAVGRWLQVSEQERLLMVGDYLWWAGWRDVEIVTLCEGKGQGGWWKGSDDPLWVVRGRKVEGQG
ncbi:hypothetical protein MMC06_003414 [Schaereria dolodes]|nr:hypothetical protein [Schaereria dolodes]